MAHDSARFRLLDTWLTALTGAIALAGFLLAVFPSSAPVNCSSMV